MTWTVPASPAPVPADAVGITEVSGATLTRFERGVLHAFAPNTWVRGAVYDHDGQLVKASLREGGTSGDKVLAADPLAAARPANARHLPGRWLYGGQWMGQFGHFITETLTSLWPAPSERVVDGLVFHPFVFGAGVTPWERELLALAGYGDLPIVIVNEEPAVVEHLVVPGRSLKLNAWADARAVDVWQRMAGAVEPGPHARVFLSRARFNEAQRAAGKPSRTTAEHDLQLEALFASRGFAVVHPETLAAREQVALAAGAEVLAGAAGSSLHLSVFAPRTCRVVEVADTRSPRRALLAQDALLAACGQERLLLPHAAVPELAELLDEHLPDENPEP